MPTAPRGPRQHPFYALLCGPHETPEAATHLADTQGHRRPRAALKAARLLGVSWGRVFFGASSVGSCAARRTGSVLKVEMTISDKQSKGIAIDE